jgi:hypothetical protein
MTISRNQNGKEVDAMQITYEAPELLLIGRADQVVLGSGGLGTDFPVGQLAPEDFEFEQD